MLIPLKEVTGTLFIKIVVNLSLFFLNLKTGLRMINCKLIHSFADILLVFKTMYVNLVVYYTNNI